MVRPLDRTLPTVEAPNCDPLRCCVSYPLSRPAFGHVIFPRWLRGYSAPIELTRRFELLNTFSAALLRLTFLGF